MTSPTTATSAMRIQLCAASAMAAVASGDNCGAKKFIPARFSVAGESSEDYLARVIELWGARPEQCPAEVKDKVERWLIATAGTELRKAKSLEKAVAAVSHVACLWTTDRKEIERMSEILMEEKREKEEEEMAALVKNAHEVASRVLEDARRERERILRHADMARDRVMDDLQDARRERERILRDADMARDRIMDDAYRERKWIRLGYRSRSPDERRRGR